MLKVMKKSKLLILILFGLSACTTPENKTQSGNLNSTLWIQTSVEYQMLCEQTYKMALSKLDEAIADSTWTALSEQTNDYYQLLPAIIVDVDETVLNNSPFFARSIKKGTSYSDSLWQAWVKETRAKGIPGAKAFIKKVKEKGVKVFFVTNRTLKGPTLENLQKEIDPNIKAEAVMCKYEKPEWNHSKVERRKEIAQDYRVLMLVGDDYNDFTYLRKISPAERILKSKNHINQWGVKWFILPNPVYGSFEKSILGYTYKMSRGDKLLKKQIFLEE